jgi:cell division protein FtsQ
LRSGNLFSNRGSTVLDAPELDRASTEGKTVGSKRGAPVTEMPLRRDSVYPNDFANDDAELGYGRNRRRAGVRLSISGGLVPTSRWGRIAAGCGLLLLAGAGVAAGLEVHRFLLRDAHFTVPGSESIQIAGNSHLTRAQLLSVFGEDVDRNIFRIPLGERREELESLPWVEHATVMRLLPNRVRVAIVERTPVAFVRQGTQIGLVDANGVLFDLPSPEMEEAGGAPVAHGAAHYSFPVLSGISAGDPLSTRAARMRIYLGFVAALDASGENISRRLSEVDLSNPEDLKAVIPDTGTGAGADILVHFGEEKFLERYRQYQQHLAEWRAQYPKLASVDMRYERQVVLEMQPGAAATTGDGDVKSGAVTQGAPR